jgi:pyridoxal biosynthesis lyase PdxS
MALQAVPADIRKEGGVARMANPEVVQQIIETVTIPVMAKAIVEAVNNYDNPAKLAEISKG